MDALADKMRVINPRHRGSPARMADGRLFTDYRANCALLPNVVGSGTWAGFEMREGMLQGVGETQRHTDRMLLSMRAARGGTVDTMVPELTKRIVTWNGVSEGMAQPVGIGGGRIPLPGRPDLVRADPDVVARAAVPDCMLPGTWAPTSLYVPGPAPAATVGPANPNRYSAPYGS